MLYVGFKRLDASKSWLTAELILFDAETEETRDFFRVKIANDGQTARILMVRVIGDNYIFQAESNTPPFYLRNGNRTDLRFYLRKEFKSTPGKLIVNVIYSDALQFFYVAMFVGDKDRVDMHPDKLLTPQEIQAYNLN